MTKCFSCARGADSCQWMRELKPVAGWEAVQTLCEGSTSYYVKSCPDFVLMQNLDRCRRRRRRRKKQ